MVAVCANLVVFRASVFALMAVMSLVGMFAGVERVEMAASTLPSSTESSDLTCEAMALAEGTLGALVKVSTVPPVVVRVA